MFRYSRGMSFRDVRRMSKATGLSDHLIFANALTIKEDRRLKDHMLDYLTSDRNT